MDMISAFAFKGELLVLKEKLIGLGLSLDDKKITKEESIKQVARCLEILDDIETLIKFDYDEI